MVDVFLLQEVRQWLLVVEILGFGRGFWSFFGTLPRPQNLACRFGNLCRKLEGTNCAM